MNQMPSHFCIEQNIKFKLTLQTNEKWRHDMLLPQAQRATDTSKVCFHETGHVRIIQV